MKRWWIGAVVLIGCSGTGRERVQPADEIAVRTAAPASKPPSPELPEPPGPLAPARIRISGTGAELADVGRCQECHADVAAQWRTSAHAFSSFSNPLYRVSIAGFRAARGAVASRFCGGCHDPALLADSALDAEVAPADPRAHAGITCLTCHGAKSATVDGNGSLDVDVHKVLLPDLGDPTSVAAHRASAAPIAGPELCASCHRSFLADENGHDSFLGGIDDYGAWQGSAFARAGMERVDLAPAATCRDCHMRPERAVQGDLAAKRGMVSSHRFLGAHSQLAAMRGDDDQLDRVQHTLSGVATIDVAAIRGEESGWHRPAEDGALMAGEGAAIDVVVRSLRVGHRFPGGTTDAHDTWVEVVVRVDGRVVASSGREHRARDEDGVHSLRSVILGDDGRPRVGREVHDFRARLVDHTIGPRGVTAVRYHWSVPERLSGPVSIEARLLHRTRNRTLSALACEDARSARGRAFADGARAAGKAVPHPCAAAPITEIAASSIVLGTPASAGSRWRRLYDHGEALLAQVQESVDEARGSLDAAWTEATSERERAAVAVAIAKLEGRQGRFESAASWVERADALGAGVSAQAALANAAAQVWRWPVAAQAWQRVTERSPDNVAAWRGLATARGSLVDDAGALAAAVRGLLLAPRDPDLLRIQAVSARALAVPGSDAAVRAFERFRILDGAAELRLRCAAEVSGCAVERMPVPVRLLD